MSIQTIAVGLLLPFLISSPHRMRASPDAADEAWRASEDPLQPTFDVVSIHTMRHDDARPEHIDNPSGSAYIRAVNVNLKSLMEAAYDMPDLRMFGGPTWLSTLRFSLEAKADSSASMQLAALPSEQAKQLKRRMIAALLADRFKLAIHTETRDLPVFALVVAKGGPKLGETKPEDEGTSPGNELLQIRSGSNSLQILAYELSWRLGRPVLDRTGLQTTQAMTLRWRDEAAVSADAGAPSLFTAIQEQLGLKLEAARGPVQILLIDHAERPTEGQ